MTILSGDKDASGIMRREMWVPMCGVCGSGHIIVAAKPSQGAMVTMECYECKKKYRLDELPFKRL